MKHSLRHLHIAGHAMIRPILAAFLLLPAFATAQAQPANDDLANAQLIPTDSFVVNGTEIGATQESFEQSSDFPYPSLGASVWYSWTPSVSGSLVLTATDPANSSVETHLSLFYGPHTPSSATRIVTAEPIAGGLSSYVYADEQLFIYVANESAEAHDFVLTGSLNGGSVTAPLPVVSLTVKKPQADSATGEIGKFLVQLSAPAAADLQITYKLGGTAVNGTDYETLSGSVTIPAGHSDRGVKIKPLLDGNSGASKVKLTLLAGDGYTLGASVKGKVTISDEP